MSEASLAAWQEVLLQRLDAGDSPAEIRRALRDDPRLAPHRAHVDRLDDDALRIAVALVARWRAPNPGTGS